MYAEVVPQARALQREVRCGNRGGEASDGCAFLTISEYVDVFISQGYVFNFAHVVGQYFTKQCIRRDPRFCGRIWFFPSDYFLPSFACWIIIALPP